MNETAIRKTAEIINRMDEQLRDKLAEKQLFEKIYIAKQIKRRRENGEKDFPLTDHIRGMVYAMLSLRFKWKQVEGAVDENTGRITELDEILYNYDPEMLLSADPLDLVKKIETHKWGSQRRKEQITGLINTNIPKLIGFQKKSGSSVDAYYQQFIEKDPTFQLLITNLAKDGSPDKIAELADAGIPEYLRNVGYDIAKPDTHVRRILGSDRLGCSEREPADALEAMEIVKQIALLCDRSAAEVDYILWSYCADGYGEICTAQIPKCAECAAAGFCVKAQQDKNA